MVSRKNYLLSTVGGLAAFASFAASVPAEAHGIWFAQRARQMALIYGVGADDLDMVKRMDKVTSITGYDENWQPVETSLREAGPIPVVDSEEPLAAIAATVDYGLWSQTPDGEWHNAGRDEVPNAVLSEHNFKNAVHLNSLTFKPVPLLKEHKLQLVPVGTSIAQSAGYPIVVRAYYDGKPMEGVSILADYVNDPDQFAIKTGADGTATLPIRNQGMNVLMAIYVAKSDKPKIYDQMEYRASLTFVLPHLPE